MSNMDTQSVIIRKVANFADFCDGYRHLSNNPANLEFCTSMMRNLPAIMVFNWLVTNCKGKTPKLVMSDFLDQFGIQEPSVPKEGMATFLRYTSFFIDIANQI